MNYNSEDSKIRRASKAASLVWDAASTAQRRSLLESLQVPKEEQDSLVSNSWHTLNSIAQYNLTSLQFRTKIKHESQDTSLSIIGRKDSAIIPERGTNVPGLANSVAQQIVAIFNEKTFNEILVNKHHIEKDFNPGWNYQDSLSRWYALGIICLTRCLMTKQWSEALPGPFDLEVYDASLDSMWVSWGMPVAIRAKVDSFMKESFLEIKKSFIDWDNRDVYKVWFRRYANRLIGANPSWEIRNGGASDDLETSLRGERSLTDVLVPPLIARAFTETGDAVLKVVCPATSNTGVKLQNLPAESARLEQSEQSPCVSEMGRDKGVDKALLDKADAGDRVAQNSIGQLYYIGIGVAQDYTQAAKWFRKAADQGNDEAQYNLGQLYVHGRGIQKDLVQAFHLYSMAAEQGNAEAQYNLGCLYQAGVVGEKDDITAVHWYRKAAENGNAEAQLMLGIEYEIGNCVQRDQSQAIIWFFKAAEQGNAVAQDNLGGLYFRGKGVLRDYSQAAFWYRKAAEQGEANAQFHLGMLYNDGNGVPQDYVQAASWHRKAAEQNHAYAQANLGLLYVGAYSGEVGQSRSEATLVVFLH